MNALDMFRKYNMLEEQYINAIIDILKAGEEFVKEIDSNIFYNIERQNCEYGYNLDELKKILESYDINIRISLPSGESKFEFFARDSVVGDPTKKNIWSSIKYQPLKVNLAIIIYFSQISKITDEKLYSPFLGFSSSEENTINVSNLIKIFIIPMLCSKEQYIENFNSSQKDEIILNLAERANIPIEWASFINNIYDVYLRNDLEAREKYESYIEQKNKYVGNFNEGGVKQKILTLIDIYNN